MSVRIRLMAAVLVPLLVLTPSCAPSRTVRLQLEDGETVVHAAEGGGQPIEVSETELWGSLRAAALELKPPADPLAFAEQTFGLTELSGTYWYVPRSNLLVAESLGGGLEEAEGPAEKLTPRISRVVRRDEAGRR